MFILKDFSILMKIFVQDIFILICIFFVFLRNISRNEVASKIQGVPVTWPFSSSVSQGLNLIKYCCSMTLFSFPDMGNFLLHNSMKKICPKRPPKVRSQNQGYAQYLIQIKRKIRNFQKSWPNSLKFVIKIMFNEFLSF